MRPPAKSTNTNNTLPFSNSTTVDTDNSPFSNKDQHITTMLNSISLSSDMKTLYLIDNGRAISYDLTLPQGVLVGLLGDQLVVATAVNLPTANDTPVDTGGRRGEVRNEPLRKFIFKVGENSQYTLSYNDKNKVLAIIGVDDIIFTLEEPEDANCTDQIFSLRDKQIVNIRWENDQLQITPIGGK